MKITCIGAARTVTGSCYHIQTRDANTLIDCGAFQGTKDNEKRIFKPFPFHASKITETIDEFAQAVAEFLKR